MISATEPLDLDQKLRAARDLMLIENHAEALRVYADLAKKYPGGPLLREYARAAAIYGDFDLAEQLWEQIRRRVPNTADFLTRLAWEHQQIRLHAKARELYRRAAEVEPQNLGAQLDLAQVLSRTSSVAEARPAVQRCLELDPSCQKARYLAAHLDRRDGKLDEAERRFRDLLGSDLKDAHLQYSCHSELAAIYDDEDRFEDAMAELQTAKKLLPANDQVETERRRIEAWHDDALKSVRGLPKNILEEWGKAFPAHARKPAVSLALLTGAARSGTTLLERVLDVHPLIAAADESLAFTKILPLVGTSAQAIPAPRLTGLRRRYLAMLTKTSGPAGAGKVLLDKNPSRTMWVPAFLRVFPEARIVMALRDPRDILASLYFQNQTNTNHLGFDLLARYYAQVMDLWLAVREWSGFSWMETRYEDLVADLPKEGAKVTRFLGLDWREQQARFHRANQEKPVMSSNYAAVSQPVYASSVGRWRAYEKHLAAVLPALEPYCKVFGYT
jgi:tetratricopeptide (TPR) repeat protein